MDLHCLIFFYSPRISRFMLDGKASYKSTLVCPLGYFWCEKGPFLCCGFDPDVKRRSEIVLAYVCVYSNNTYMCMYVYRAFYLSIHLLILLLYQES